jgi:hypothetical protein
MAERGATVNLQEMADVMPTARSRPPRQWTACQIELGVAQAQLELPHEHVLLRGMTA